MVNSTSIYIYLAFLNFSTASYIFYTSDFLAVFFWNLMPHEEQLITIFVLKIKDTYVYYIPFEGFIFLPIDGINSSKLKKKKDTNVVALLRMGHIYGVQLCFIYLIQSYDIIFRKLTKHISFNLYSFFLCFNFHFLTLFTIFFFLTFHFFYFFFIKEDIEVYFIKELMKHKWFRENKICLFIYFNPHMYIYLFLWALLFFSKNGYWPEFHWLIQENKIHFFIYWFKNKS